MEKISTLFLASIIAALLGVLTYMMYSGQSTADSGTKATPALESAPSLEQTPNVLLIILDDVGLDYFPEYLPEHNFIKANMPVTESLMESGYIFNNLNTYAMCSPTRASLLTGHHGVETGVLDPGRTSYLDPKWQSLQQEIKKLSNNTIASAVFGKWHLLGHEGDISHPNLFVDHYEGIPTGNHESYFEWDKVVNGTLVRSDAYSTTDITDSALNWIAEQDGQWFTWLAYTAPHTPLHLPPADLHSDSGLTGSEQDMRRNKERYMNAMLEAADTEIGRLLSSLAPEVRANTYVILIGDNGTSGSVSQEPFRSIGAKGSLQAGGIHAPMVVFNPYRNGSGKQIDTLTSTIDFYPTILDMFSLTTATKLPGSSFYPLVSDTDVAHTPNKFIFSQNLEEVTVRSSTHRLIRTNEGDERLYDLTNDQFEMTDLIKARLSSTDQAALSELGATLDDFLKGVY